MLLPTLKKTHNCQNGNKNKITHRLQQESRNLFQAQFKEFMQTESLWLLQASVSGVLTQCAAAQPDAKHGVDRR